MVAFLLLSVNVVSPLEFEEIVEFESRDNGRASLSLSISIWAFQKTIIGLVCARNTRPIIFLSTSQSHIMSALKDLLALMRLAYSAFLN